MKELKPNVEKFGGDVEYLPVESRPKAQYVPADYREELDRISQHKGASSDIHNLAHRAFEEGGPSGPPKPGPAPQSPDAVDRNLGAWKQSEPQSMYNQRTGGPGIEYGSNDIAGMKRFIDVIGEAEADRLYRDDYRRFGEMFDAFRANASGFANWWHGDHR